MCLILQCHPRTHIRDLLKELGWLSVKQRIMLLNYVMIYKILNRLAPSYLSDLFTRPHHQHSTRSSTSGNLYVQKKKSMSLFKKDVKPPCNSWPRKKITAQKRLIYTDKRLFTFKLLLKISSIFNDSENRKVENNFSVFRRSWVD